jgi:hypothetical protein
MTLNKQLACDTKTRTDELNTTKCDYESQGVPSKRPKLYMRTPTLIVQHDITKRDTHRFVCAHIVTLRYHAQRKRKQKITNERNAPIIHVRENTTWLLGGYN